MNTVAVISSSGKAHQLQNLDALVLDLQSECRLLIDWKRVHKYISDHIISLRLHLTNSRYLNLISVYAPTMDNDDEIKGAFYEEVTNVLTKIHPTQQILLLGDFNAHIGRDCDA
ncbi:unnamed protein product [Parnassius apollo]|uniref:(apollo) hypothetical protein n=1 Tax=Parnassius apollo TaxID=110799 RepID=A0A8S3XNH2_PARAO|nr:unnamed protein product [Parnassius apollo]